MLDGLITTLPPPANRVRGCEGEFARHFSERAPPDLAYLPAARSAARFAAAKRLSRE
jgi:hypothetical protein